MENVAAINLNTKNVATKNMAMKNVANQMLATKTIPTKKLVTEMWQLKDGDKKCGYIKMATKDVAIESWQP